jgi:FHS family L-fucose permease-like MFS transporter
MSNTSSNRPLYTLISIFFFWGFVAASNTVLIGIFKENFQLSQFHAQLVEWAFYTAYFVGSLLFFTISFFKGDPLGRIGYKNGLVIGLVISAAGAFLFVPAASMQSFPLMLSALFIVGLGFALQQIVANPYVIALGDPAKGSHRINLAGGINSFGTTIGPLLVSFAIYRNVTGDAPAHVGIDTVKMPYVILALAFLLFAAILGFSKLPAVTNKEDAEKGLGALKYPQLVLGMIAIFAYVGVEVTIQSNLPSLIKLPEIRGISGSQGIHFISLYWGGLMVGRWTGAVAVFNFSEKIKKLMTVVMPLAAYAVILVVNYIKGSPMTDLINYFPFVLLFIGAFFLTGGKPARTMLIFGSMAAIMMIVGLLTEGTLALYSFISGGLFCSVMWPCIYSLAIAGLGKYTSQGSSLLIMMILGGALIPPLQGLISDTTGIHNSYFIPVICFAYLAFYGWKVKGVLKSQGMDYDTMVSSGH